MSFFKKIEGLVSLVERVPEGIERSKEQIKGILNPNHRHDDPEEKDRDRIRKEIRDQHRFNSFAGERAENFVKWHIGRSQGLYFMEMLNACLDGHDYMYALSEMLEKATECIFILDWWLSPELYLRRPPGAGNNDEWRLDRILKRKAKQGVKIYIIVYKEVTQTMNMSSHHTKEFLEAINKELEEEEAGGWMGRRDKGKICVMRHPDHVGAVDTVEFWSHHEKVVVVDNHRACIGGLDLCFGRWDTHNHPLADVHPTNFSNTLFPGQDYNNARVLDFQHVDSYASNAISILETARMPWHDVHMTLTGPVVLDITQHFIERWNEVKKRKYSNDNSYDWLAFPHNVIVAPNEPIARHPHLHEWHEIGHRFRQRFQWHPDEPSWEEHENDEEVFPRAPHGTCNVQVVRSVSDWSHGVLTEDSIQRAYCQLIMEASHFIYIENQFFISNTGPNQGPVKNLIAQALTQRIIQAARDNQKFKVIIVIPEVPGFAGNMSDDKSLKTIMAAQYRTINRGGNSIYEEVQKAGYDPMEYIRLYHLRSYDRINAPLQSYITKVEESSGINFHQAQVALAKQWVGDTPTGVKNFEQRTAAIKVPQPSQEGVTQGKDSQTIQEVPLPVTEEEAMDIIARFEDGAKQLRGDENVADNVGQHALQDTTGLLDEQWLGTEQEEKDSYITELLYIHTKLMIVDDKRVIMGSANINDRSQKGDGDSEIALVVEDTDLVQSTMDGKPYMATRFASSLRRKLFREHLGLIPPQNVRGSREKATSFMKPAPIMNENETSLEEDRIVTDPLSDELLDLWNKTATRNRGIFTELFRTVPSDLVSTWAQYKEFVPKVKAGHLLPDIPLERAKQRLAEVKGHLVDAPLRFLIDEKELVDNADWKGLNPTLPVYI